MKAWRVLVRLPALAVFVCALSYPLPVIVMFFVRSPVFGSTSITQRPSPPAAQSRSFSCNDGLRMPIVPPVVAGGTITMV